MNVTKLRNGKTKGNQNNKNDEVQSHKRDSMKVMMMSSKDVGRLVTKGIVP